MLILRLCLIWALIVVHIVGGAALFSRNCKRESPWFGFIVPCLVVAMAMNFIEHGGGFSSFRWALPITFIGSIWLILSPKIEWRRLWFPAAVFVVAFTFTLLVHGLKPDVESVRDGRLDTHLIADYCMGETLPPTSTWEAGCKQLYYYSFEHYAASVMVRLMGFDIGTGFNVAGALASAFIFFLIGAIAWRIGGKRHWIVVVTIFLTASAMTGSTAFLWLMKPDNKDPDDTTNLLNRADPHHSFPFDHWLNANVGCYDQRELLVPGYWAWIGSFHSVVAGQLLTLLAVYCAVEMARGTRSVMPWIFGLVSCLLILVCSAWGLPFIGILFLCTAGYCLQNKFYPENWRGVLIGWGVAAVLMSPMLLYYLATEAPGIGPIQPIQKTELAEFIIQWWPIYLPWLSLIFLWRNLNPVVRIIIVLVPLSLVSLEHFNIADRMDFTGKLWGYLFGGAWAVLIPSLAAMRSYVTHTLLGFFLAAGCVSVCFWVDYTHRTLPGDDMWHIDGLGDFRTDSMKGRILQTLSTMDHRVIVSGECKWAYNESAGLAALSHNYAYVADDFDCDNHFGAGRFDEAKRRADAINAIYEAKTSDALDYLREHRISAMVIWPEDNVSNDTLEKLKAQLSACYWYRDCRNEDAGPNDPTAGVFLLRNPKSAVPEM